MKLREKVESTLRALGASEDLLTRRKLPLFEDATDLRLAHTSQSGRRHFLCPEPARQWMEMREAAAASDLILVMISGFRSFDRQLELIESRLSAGEDVDDILEVLAPPGCSEHHTGRAVDIGSPGAVPLSENFEETKAFGWLRTNAENFGFHLSYPRGNPFGYRYEPWHWCHR